MRISVSPPPLSCLILACCGILASPASSAGKKSAGPETLFEARYVGQLFEKGKSSHIIGQDGVYSVSAGKDRVLWLFGDTWIGEVKADGSESSWGTSSNAGAVSVSTSAAFIPGRLEYLQDENGWPLSVIQFNPGENQSVRRLWPQHGLTSGTTFYVFYSLIQHFGPSQAEYARIGQGLASSQSPLGPYTRLKWENSHLFWNDIEPSFGSAVLEDADGWVYLYGRILSEPGKFALALARVKRENLPLRDKYYYYGAGVSSGTWTDDLSEAAWILDDIPPDFSVSYNTFLKKYLMLSSGQTGSDVLMRTAEEPWGPWSVPSGLLICPAEGSEDYCYGAKEHPELSSDEGEKIYFTLEKAGRYIPLLYEIEFKEK